MNRCLKGLLVVFFVFFFFPAGLWAKDTEPKKWGLGGTLGIAIIAPDDINRKIDKFFSGTIGTEETDINSAVNFSGILTHYPQPNIEVCLGIDYLLHIHKCKVTGYGSRNLDVTLSSLTPTLSGYYLHRLLEGLQLKAGCGLGFYSAKAEFDYSSSLDETYDGFSMGYHLFLGGELCIENLKLSGGLLARSAEVDAGNLTIDLSGVEIKFGGEILF